MIRLDGTLAVCGDDYLFLCGDEQHDRKEVARFSSSDYDAMAQFDAMVQKVGAVIRNQMLLTEADIFHGRHDLDQIFSLRPHPKAAQYRTPIENLYLCGSGAHPGGGVSGAPGHNAASRVITDFKRR